MKKTKLKYQLLETYRYGAIVKFKRGSKSQAYWIEDIISVITK